MTAIKSLAQIAQTGQSLALAVDNIKFARSKKKKKGEDILKVGVKNIVGIQLIRETGKIISSL